jgi:hypothetical protein
MVAGWLLLAVKLCCVELKLKLGAVCAAAGNINTCQHNNATMLNAVILSDIQ